jgi:hypothetical protein
MRQKMMKMFKPDKPSIADEDKGHKFMKVDKRPPKTSNKPTKISMIAINR